MNFKVFKIPNSDLFYNFLRLTLTRGFDVRYNQRDKVIVAKLMIDDNKIEIQYLKKFIFKKLKETCEAVNIKMNNNHVDFLPAKELSWENIQRVLRIEKQIDHEKD